MVNSGFYQPIRNPHRPHMKIVYEEDSIYEQVKKAVADSKLEQKKISKIILPDFDWADLANDLRARKLTFKALEAELGVSLQREIKD